MGWNSELHPRARNGKFISKGGFVHWKVGKKSGAGTVSSIGHDGIVVKDKKTGKAMKLRSRDITDATEPKASISIKGKKQGKAWGKMWGVDVDAKAPKLSKEEKRKALRERVHNQQLASDLAMALSAALPGKFDPLKHPRGKDGKFIKVGGWVKWTLGSHEYRGQVKKIDGDGKVTVAMGTGKNGVPITRHIATKNLSQAAPNKATLGQPAWMPSSWAGHDENLRKVESNGPAMAELGLLKNEAQPAITQDTVDHYAKQIDAEKAARDAHRAELKKQGLSDRDVESVMKNGYIMPDPTDVAKPEPTPSILDFKDRGGWGERLVQAGYSLHLLDAMGVDTYGLADGRTVKAEDYYLPAGLSPADRKKVEQVRATYNSASKGDKLIVPGHDGPLTVSHVMPKAVYATDAKGDTYELKPGEFTKDGALPTEKKLTPPSSQNYVHTERIPATSLKAGDKVLIEPNDSGMADTWVIDKADLSNGEITISSHREDDPTITFDDVLTSSDTLDRVTAITPTAAPPSPAAAPSSVTIPPANAAPSTPEAPSAPSAPAPSAPNPDKITPDTYGGKLTKDGKVPKVGQMVTTGKAGLKGKVLKVIEKRGWIQVELPDGTKKVTTLNTTTVDAEPGEAPDVPKAPDVSKAAKPPSAPSPAPKVALSIPDQSYAAQAVDDYAWAVTKDGDEGTYSNFLDVRDKLKSGDGSNLTPDDLNMMRTALYNQPQSPKRDALIAKIDAMLGTKPAAPAPAKPAALSPDVVTDLAVGDGKKLTDLVVKAVSDAGLGVKNPGYYDGSRGWTTAQGSTGFSVRDLGDGKLHLNIVLSPKAMGIPKQPEVLYEDGQEVTYYKPNEEVAKAKATDVANLVRSIGLNPISAVNDGYSLVDDHIEYGVVIDDPRKPKPKPKPKSTVGVSKPKATGSIKVPAGKNQRDKIITALEDAADKVSPDERTVYDDIAKRIDAGLGLSVSDAGRVLDALNDAADNPANGPADYNLIGFYQKALAGKKPMTSAGFARFNPSQHPRGADGRFIEVGGFVSWLVRGNRKTGKVLKVDNQAKTAVVQMDDGTPVTLPAEKLYKADRKAKIDYRSFAFDRTRKFGPDTPDEELQKIAFDKDAIWNGTDLDSTDVQDARYELERRANEQMFERATKRRQGITAGSGASGTFSSNGQRFSTPMPTPPAAQPRRARRRRQPVSDRLGGPAPTRSQLGPPPKQEWTKQPAATPGWQATEHPRGADGRFVEVGGFVEWKDPAGKPGRGQVTKMNGDGTVVIKQDNGTEATVPASQVRQQPKVKARLNPAFVQRQVRHQIRQNQ